MGTNQTQNLQSHFRNLPLYDTATINQSIDYTQASAGEVKDLDAWYLREQRVQTTRKNKSNRKKSRRQNYATNNRYFV